MDSPAAAGAPRSAARPHRKPLQPINSTRDPAAWRFSKPKDVPISAIVAGKENSAAEVGMMVASLADELDVLRRRKERLRAERERTEVMLREMEEALERGVWEVEGRWEEQRKIEMQVDRLIRIRGLRFSPAGLSPFRSLRAREQEKRSLESPIQVSPFLQSSEKVEEQEQKTSGPVLQVIPLSESPEKKEEQKTTEATSQVSPLFQTPKKEEEQKIVAATPQVLDKVASFKKIKVSLLFQSPKKEEEQKTLEETSQVMEV